eukprot:979444-Prymnesium_polylepis.1
MSWRRGGGAAALLEARLRAKPGNIEFDANLTGSQGLYALRALAHSRQTASRHRVLDANALAS